MRKNVVLIVVAIVLFLVAVFAWKIASQPSDSNERPNIAGDQIDIVLDFYGAWLDSRKAGSDEAFKPLEFEFLSQELRAELGSFDFTSDTIEFDPVLCRTSIPEGFRSRLIFEGDERTEVLVLASESNTSEQAIVTLEPRNDAWTITDIECGTGEQAPELGEYSFEESGHLLKDSLPNAFDKEYWHLVFTVEGVPGHTALLMFDNGSVCIAENGSESTCNPDSFVEASAVRVQGQLSEAGVEVERVEFTGN